MGVDAFVRWSQQQHPVAVERSGRPARVHHAYADLTLFLMSAQAAKRERVGEPRAAAKAVGSWLDRCLQQCAPTVSVFLALDGPGAVARLYDQRKRRKNPKDTTRGSVTAGSEFLAEFTEGLEEWAKQWSSDKDLSKVVISPASAAGDADLKILGQASVNSLLHPEHTHAIFFPGSHPSESAILATAGVVRNVYLFMGPNANKNPTLAVDRVVERILISVGDEKPSQGTANLTRLDLLVLSALSGNEYLPKLYTIESLLSSYVSWRSATPAPEWPHLIRTRVQDGTTFLVFEWRSLAAILQKPPQLARLLPRSPDSILRGVLWLLHSTLSGGCLDYDFAQTSRRADEEDTTLSSFVSQIAAASDGDVSRRLELYSFTLARGEGAAVPPSPLETLLSVTPPSSALVPKELRTHLFALQPHFSDIVRGVDSVVSLLQRMGVPQGWKGATRLTGDTEVTSKGHTAHRDLWPHSRLTFDPMVLTDPRPFTAVTPLHTGGLTPQPKTLKRGPQRGGNQRGRGGGGGSSPNIRPAQPPRHLSPSIRPRPSPSCIPSALPNLDGSSEMPPTMSLGPALDTQKRPQEEVEHKAKRQRQ